MASTRTLGFAVVVLLVGVLVMPSGLPPLALAGLVILAAGGLLLEVEPPGGGTISMGHAVVIAFAGLLSIGDFVGVVGLALLLIAVPQVHRHGKGRGLLTMLLLSCAAAAGLAGRMAGTALVSGVSAGHRTAIVAPVVLAGLAYLAVIFVLQVSVAAGIGWRRRWRSALSIYLSLLCAAALLALASERAPALGAVALAPLLVMRFSFRRYSDARRTYLQTTQALSMIPEVAGLTPLGHGERTAVYAAALAEALGFPPEEVDVVATVARLHHIGHVAHPDLPPRPLGPDADDRRLIGDSGAKILAGTGFLRDLASTVAAVHGAPVGELTEAEAVVRVASTLDDLVGVDPAGASEAVVGLLARHETGIERTMALRLAELCDAHPALAERACAVGISVSGPGFSLAANDR